MNAFLSLHTLFMIDRDWKKARLNKHAYHTDRAGTEM